MNLSRLFQEAGTPFRAPRGTVVFNEGDRLSNIAWLEAGRVRVFRSRSADRDGTLYYLRAGQLCLVSCVAAMRGVPLPASAVVEEDAVGRTLSATAFQRFFAEDEALRSAFFDTLADRIVAILDLLQDMQQLSVDDRLVRYLLDRARVGSGQAGLGRLSTTHERIAADLWTAREVVSRSLKTLEREGLVVVERGTIIVKNPQALAARAARPEREH